MHIYTYIMCAHIHTYTYIHIRIQNVHMNARKACLKRRRGSDCAGSPTSHQESLPFSLSATRQRTVQTTCAYLHWCGADPPSSLSTPAPSLAMPAHGPPKRGHFSAILAGFSITQHKIMSANMEAKSCKDSTVGVVLLQRHFWTNRPYSEGRVAGHSLRSKGLMSFK